MGHPKRSKKRYEKPRRPWETTRIKEERELAETYGLKNKREIWKATTIIKKYRREIRAILAEMAGLKPREHTLKKKEAILAALRRRGILKESEGASSGLEDILALNVEDVLERRLQTRVYKKGLSNSLKHARQLIVHGHIAVDGRRVTVPSYIVDVDEERKIGYYGQAPITVEEKGDAGEVSE
ncbi:MAG: 30S ribosomal protein S4 [Candidatus Methanospirareceae archaeon]